MDDWTVTVHFGWRWFISFNLLKSMVTLMKWFKNLGKKLPGLIRSSASVPIRLAMSIVSIMNL